MKNVKRIISLCLALVLLLGTFSVTAFAAPPVSMTDATEVGDFFYLTLRIANKGLTDEDMQQLLALALDAIGKDAKNMTVDDILNLPANEMDYVVTYIFSGLKAVGVKVDALYEKLTSNKIMNWYVNTYYKDVVALNSLRRKIEAKGLTPEDMTVLLSSALRSVGKDMKLMTTDDILNLPPNMMDDVVTYIFAGLKALGVDVDALYEKLTSNKILNWFVNAFCKEPVTDNMAILEMKIAYKGLDSTDMVTLMGSAISSVGKNMKEMTKDEILNLPASDIEDVVTYIFAGLKSLGVNVDALYEKLPSNEIFNWFVKTYCVALPMDTGSGNLTSLEKKIAAKGLDRTDMITLLSSALSSIGKKLRDMTPGDILNLPAKEMDDMVTYIFAGLKALGVDVDALYEKLSSNKVLNWFINTYYYPTASVTVSYILTDRDKVQYGGEVVWIAHVENVRGGSVVWYVNGQRVREDDYLVMKVKDHAEVVAVVEVNGVEIAHSTTWTMKMPLWYYILHPATAIRVIYKWLLKTFKALGSF